MMAGGEMQHTMGQLAKVLGGQHRIDVPLPQLVVADGSSWRNAQQSRHLSELLNVRE